LARREPESLREAAQRCLDPLRRERFQAGERGTGLGEDRRAAVELRPIRLDRLEQEAGVRRVLAQLRDLLLDEWRRAADERLVPCVALLLQVRGERVRVDLGRQRAQI